MPRTVAGPAHADWSTDGASDLAAEVARVRERFERLLEAGILIGSERSVEQVLQQVTESARVVVGARYAALGVLSEDGTSLVHFEVAGLGLGERERIGPPPTGKGLLGAVIRERRPVRVRRIPDDPRAHGFPANHPRMDSFLGVPISGRSRVYGNLYLTDKIGADEFTDEDEAIAVMLAAQAAAAIESARLYEEQADLLARLQTLRRQRDQFFAMINHELRNALTGVYGWAEQLLRQRNEAGMQRAGREVYESAERTITLLNNLLDLSRMEAGRVNVVARDLVPSDVLRRACSVIQPAADAKRLVLRPEFLETPDSFVSDAAHLEQVLVNLLSNAIRHSPSGEDVVIRVEGTTDELLFSVIDRGPGIAHEDQGKIFEPYIRVDPDSGLGSGLGLPVSRRLTELLGGRLTVHSALGRGATFTVALPLGPKTAGR